MLKRGVGGENRGWGRLGGERLGKKTRGEKGKKKPQSNTRGMIGWSWSKKLGADRDKWGEDPAKVKKGGNVGKSGGRNIKKFRSQRKKSNTL